MLTLVPPFYTSNILSLANKICSGEYDLAPLKYYSDHLIKIITECLCIDPQRRPDICSVARLCTEELMSYTDRSCAKIQSLEKSLRQQDHQREFELLRQQSQLQQQLAYHQSWLNNSNAKESSGGTNSSIPDVSVDVTDGQSDITRPDAFTAGK